MRRLTKYENVKLPKKKKTYLDKTVSSFLDYNACSKWSPSFYSSF